MTEPSLRVVCQSKILEPYVLITRCRIFISMPSEKCTENNVLILFSGSDIRKKTHLKKIPTNPTCSLLKDWLLTTVFTEAAVAVGTGWGLLNVFRGEMVMRGWKLLWLIVGVGYGMLTPNCRSRSPSP